MKNLHGTVCALLLMSLVGCFSSDPESQRPERTTADNPVSQTPSPVQADTQRGPAETLLTSSGEPVQSVFTASATVSSTNSEASSKNNWPRFRGHGGLGVSKATGLPTEWSKTKNMVWTTPLPGHGSSSPIVYGDRVYVTCYSGYGLNQKSPGDMSRLKRHLVCVGRDDGKIRWTRTLASDHDVARFKDPGSIGRHGYATATPVADESGVYVFYGSSGAVGYTHAGKQKWRQSCGTKTHDWGTASSPLLYKGLYIIHADVESHALIALDKHTGKEKWRIANRRGPSTWCTPIFAKTDGRDELIYSDGSSRVAGVDPHAGKLLWQCQTHVGLINGSPVAFEGAVVVFGSYSGKAAAVRIGGRGDVTGTHKLWEIHKGAYMTSPVYHDGHLYFTRDGRIAYCVAAKTGKVVYQNRFESHDVTASPVIADGKLYYVSTEAGAFVLDARPAFRVLAHNKIAGDNSVFNGSPAVSGGRLILRSNKALYCVGTR